MRIQDFDFYQDFLKRHAGIILRQNQSFLLDSRLTPVARKWNFPSLGALTLHLRGMPEPELINDILNVMTDTDTSFMRDEDVFAELSFKILPWLNRARKKSEKIRLWSAGCATGQEAWSMAMMVLESPAAFRPGRVQILGTDLSSDAIEKAQAGRYTQFEIQRNLPAPLMTGYFTADGNMWNVNKELRKFVHFETQNLLHPPHIHADTPPFDVIFCRNVARDLDEDDRDTLFTHLRNRLSPDGFLMLGTGETPPIHTGLHEVEGLSCTFARQGAHESFKLAATV